MDGSKARGAVMRRTRPSVCDLKVRYATSCVFMRRSSSRLYLLASSLRPASPSSLAPHHSPSRVEGALYTSTLVGAREAADAARERTFQCRRRPSSSGFASQSRTHRDCALQPSAAGPVAGRHADSAQQDISMHAVGGFMQWPHKTCFALRQLHQPADFTATLPNRIGGRPNRALKLCSSAIAVRYCASMQHP